MIFYIKNQIELAKEKLGAQSVFYIPKYNSKLETNSWKRDEICALQYLDALGLNLTMGIRPFFLSPCVLCCKFKSRSVTPRVQSPHHPRLDQNQNTLLDRGKFAPSNTSGKIEILQSIKEYSIFIRLTSPKLGS